MGKEKQTPLYEEHLAQGAKMVPFAGWSMPLQYAGIVAEHASVRTAAGLFDVSHMGQLRLTGDRAAQVVDSLITNDLQALEVSRGLYTCCCNQSGGILDDLIVYRTSPTSVLVVCNASNRQKIAKHLEEHAAGQCEVDDVTDSSSLIALQGPNALGILKAARLSIDIDRELPRFRWAIAKLGHVRCAVARTGYTGEDGVELFCARGDSVALWRTLLTIGSDFGIVPAGLGARDTLRLEACLSLYGHELDEGTNPYEAGLGWTVKLDAGQFLGKAALEAVQRQGVSRTLVGFEMVGRGSARAGYAIADSAGRSIGRCSSGGPSPTLGKSIGLGFVPPEFATLNSPLWIDCRGKSIEARVVKTPMYRRTASS